MRSIRYFNSEGKNQYKLVYSSFLVCLLLLSPLVTLNPVNSSRIGVKNVSNSSERNFAIYVGGNTTLEASAYSKLEKEITKLDFNYKRLGQMASYEDLVDLDVLMILGLETLEESRVNITMLKKYLIEGGSLLLAPSFKDPLGMENLLKLVGLNTTSTLINTTTKENKAVLSNTWNNKSYLYNDVTNLTVANGTMIREAGEKEKTLNLTVRKHSTLWGNNNTTIKEGGETGKKIHGKNLTMVYEGELWTGGRVIVLPSILMLSNQFFPQNKAFGINIIRWLAKVDHTIIISDLSVSQTKVKLQEENSKIKVTFKVLNDSFVPIMNNISLHVIMGRLFDIVRSVSVNSNQTPKSVDMNIPSDMERGTYGIMVRAYKRFYGFSWSERLEIIVYKSWLSPASFRTKAILSICFGVPILFAFFFIMKSLQEYRENRKRIRTLEEKGEAKT